MEEFFKPNNILLEIQKMSENAKNVHSVRAELLNYMNEKKKQTLLACGGIKQDFCFLDVEEDEDDEQDVQSSSKENKKRSLTSTHESGGGGVKRPMDLFVMKKKTKRRKLMQTSINNACDRKLRY